MCYTLGILTLALLLQSSHQKSMYVTQLDFYAVHCHADCMWQAHVDCHFLISNNQWVECGGFEFCCGTQDLSQPPVCRSPNQESNYFWAYYESGSVFD